MATSELPDRRIDAAPALSRLREDARWLVPVWLVVGAFACLAIARSIQVGIAFKDPHGDILATRVAISLAFLVFYALLDVAWRMRRARIPWRLTWHELRSRWTAYRIVMALGALAAYHVTYFCYHNLKSWDVLLRPRDSMLLGWDRFVFVGHSPAVLLHDLLGQHVAAWILAYWYETFGTLVLVAIVVPLVFVERIRDGYVAMVAGVWIWILGTATYYAIPTLGPFGRRPGSSPGCRT